VVVVADAGSGLLSVVKPSYHHSLDRTRGASSTTTTASPPGRTTNDGPRAPAAAALFPLRRSRSEGEDQPLDAPPLQLPPPPPAATAVGGAESGEEEEEEEEAYLQPRRPAPRQKQQQPTVWRRGRERGRPGDGGDEALLQIRAPLLRAAATERSGSGAAAGKQVESERWATAVAYAREARREIGAPAAARRELVAGRMRERCRQQRVERRAEERAATTRRAREGHLRHVVLLAPLLALALVLRHVLHLL
jgi:hypothetical protein